MPWDRARNGVTVTEQVEAGKSKSVQSDPTLAWGAGRWEEKPKLENSLTCLQVCGWPVTVPRACAAGLGFAWLSLFLMVDRDALFKRENNRNKNQYKKREGQVDL